MEQLLDLSITLTSPPPGTPSHIIASMDMRCDLTGLAHTGDLLIDPLTDEERESLRWYLEEYWKWPYEQFLKRGRQVEDLLADLGKRLYTNVFKSSQAGAILQAWRLYPEVQQRRISLLSDVPKVLSMPWELLHDEQGFLVLRSGRTPISIIRRLPQSELAAFPTPFELPLRVLLVTARPNDAGFVDPRNIARKLLDEVHSQIEAGTISLEFLRPPTLSALRTRLNDSKRPTIHVLHFDGHGTFDAKIDSGDGLRLSGGKRGMLVFENEESMLDLVEADNLAQVLQGSGVRLAMLTACQSAMGAADDAFSSVAARLIRGGVDAVAAMSASVLVASAALYVEIFYRELAKGTPASIAQERARQKLHDDPKRHMHQRRRDEKGEYIELRDWWLPHFYQQRPLILQSTQPRRRRKKPQDTSRLPRLGEEMPDEPRYGFSGRARELLQIERWLMQSKLVVIHGFGGIGKTALVREAADWLTRTGMYNGSCFVSFEHGGDATAVLSALGNYLGIYDENYNLNDKTAAIAQLKTALKERRILVVADNLESILPGGSAPLESTRRIQLWNILLELAAIRVGMLLTSRDTLLGDDRLMQGNKVAHLELKGLHPEDAYALASQLLKDLMVDHKRAPYRELRELLTQLDHHPLAIQMVLPTLRELEISKLNADFSALLPAFTDEKATGRNRSLLASLDYSLQRLDTEQRMLLAQLATFESGVNEYTLREITQISESEWSKLQLALEQVALLTIERVAGIEMSFLHFHPILIPYLRSLLGAEDKALRNRYIASYYYLAKELYEIDHQKPWAARKTAQRELLNLRRALELMLEEDEVEAASVMAEYIAEFLTAFGFVWEREELHRRVAEAITDVSPQKGEALSLAEWLQESSRSQDEFYQGNIHASFIRETNLLARIQAQPRGKSLGPGSREHALVLHRLARRLQMGGQLTAAEERLREAQLIYEELIRQSPDNPFMDDQFANLLVSLGEVLLSQGRSLQAQETYQKALEIAKQRSNPRSEAMILQQLGALAIVQEDYDKALAYYNEAANFFSSLEEPVTEANWWHQMGILAQRLKRWSHAEEAYRKSLEIRVQLGDAVGITQAYHQLGRVAESTHRFAEAEGWYKQALESVKRVLPDSDLHATYLSSLASSLLDEAQEERAPKTRLAEAQGYAEQALAIRKKLGFSSDVWKSLNILAKITDLDGHVEQALHYRRRAHEAYATLADNRLQIDQNHGELIIDITRAAIFDKTAQEKVEANLPQLETDGWCITEATRRLWNGERDWHSLAENLATPDEALLVLRVVETLEQFASLPLTVRASVERQDVAALKQALQALSSQERQTVNETLKQLNIVKNPGTAGVVKEFEPLLRAIAAVAVGETVWQSEVDVALTDLEVQGLDLKDGVQRIWTGERDPEILRGQMSELQSALLHRVLEIIAEPRNRQETLQERMAALPSAIREALVQGDTAAFEQALEILPLGEQYAVRETMLMLEELSVPEQLFALLPTAIQEAWEQGDETAFDQAFEALSSEEQQRGEVIIGYLQSLDENTGEESYTSDETDDIEGLEPLLQGIAAVAVGDITKGMGIEGLLTTLEITGWPIKKIVQRIWAGERDIATLTKGLTERDTALVLRILEIIAGG